MKTHAPIEFKTNEKGTTHLVTADAEGNVVALTTTVNGPFGASIVAGDTGIPLNNGPAASTSPEDHQELHPANRGPGAPHGEGGAAPRRPLMQPWEPGWPRMGKRQPAAAGGAEAAAPPAG